MSKLRDAASSLNTIGRPERMLAGHSFRLLSFERPANLVG